MWRIQWQIETWGSKLGRGRKHLVFIAAGFRSQGNAYWRPTKCEFTKYISNVGRAIPTQGDFSDWLSERAAATLCPHLSLALHLGISSSTRFLYIACFIGNTGYCRPLILLRYHWHSNFGYHGTIQAQGFSPVPLLRKTSDLFSSGRFLDRVRGSWLKSDKCTS